MGSVPVRGLWATAGLICVGVGGVGVVVPGLPSTIFFIMAAACFTRSSPRLEAWVLRLPGFGQAVRDYRAGLGMPARAKVAAVASIVVFGGAAGVWALTTTTSRVVLAVACAIGITVVLRQPTKQVDAAAGGPATRRARPPRSTPS